MHPDGARPAPAEAVIDEALAPLAHHLFRHVQLLGYGDALHSRATQESIRDRVARTCAASRRRVHASKRFRSLGEMDSRAFGRPRFMMSPLNSKDNTDDL